MSELFLVAFLAIPDSWASLGPLAVIDIIVGIALLALVLALAVVLLPLWLATLATLGVLTGVAWVAESVWAYARWRPHDPARRARRPVARRLGQRLRWVVRFGIVGAAAPREAPGEAPDETTAG